jgi:acetylserotonin N-methyltransferase
VEPILELIDAFRRSKTLFAAVELGVFEALQEQDLSAAKLAKQLQVNADALERLLDACAGLGLLARTDACDNTSDCRYALNDLSRAYLLRSAPQSMNGYIFHSNRVVLPLFRHLEKAVKSGASTWSEAFGQGMSKAELFDRYFASEADKRQFYAGMHTFAVWNAPALVSAFDFSQSKRLVDLGGESLPVVSVGPSIDRST